ncbi:MAG: HEAT repeat domain-containing protein [Acidobacteriota bacterium]|nr:HEAT repeat domain-containing protein [Acidobacteriota bacterium]
MRRVPIQALLCTILVSALLAGQGLAQSYDFDSTIAGLSASDEAGRQAAIERLCGIGVLALPSVLEALDDGNPTVRQGARAAAEVIVYGAAGTYNAPIAASSLMTAFATSGSRPWVRDHTMHLLSLVASNDQVPALAELLDDRQLGEAALYVLTRVGGPASASVVDGALGQALQTGDEARAVALVEGLGRMGVATPNSIRALDGAEPLALAALASLPKAADPAVADDILRMASCPSPAVADAARGAILELACSLLAAEQTGAAADLFAKALGLPLSVQERAWAISGYSRAGGDAEALLWEAMGSGEPALVGMAMRELVTYGPDPLAIADRVRTAFSPEREGLIWMLGEVGGRDAVSALRGLVGHPDPTTRRAVYTALAKNPDARAAISIVDALAADDPALRAESLSLVDRTPGPAVSRAIERNLKSPTTPADVRLALATSLSHRRASEAVEPLVWAARSDNVELRKAALNSLAALRDPLVIAPLLSLANALAPDEQPLAVAAIAAVPHAEAQPVLLRALGTATAPEAATVLRVLATYGDPALRGTFAVAARHADGRVAAAALSGLADIPAPGVIALLSSYAKDGREIVSASAKAGLLTVAESRDPQDEVALATYHDTLADASASMQTKRRALQGVARIGNPRSLPLVEPMLDEPGEVANDVAAALASIAKAVGVTDRARAIGICERILRVSQDRATLTSAAATLRDFGVTADIAGPAGFITGWWVTPPIADRTTMEEGDPLTITDHIDPLQPIQYKDQTFPWTFHQVVDPLGVLDLETASARQDNVGAYALATVVSDRDRDVVLRIGSDDGLAVYVNGEEVHRNFLDRAWALDQDTVTAKLRAGDNQILCKVTQGGAQWSVSVRVTENDQPLVLPQKGPRSIAEARGVIGAWWFTDRVGSQQGLRDADVVDPAGPIDTAKPVMVDGKPVPWRYVQVDDLQTGYLSLRGALGSQEDLGVYGYAEFTPANAGRAILSLGSDDDIYVWLNGELVHRMNATRAAIPGDDQVEVDLRDGVNTLLVKVLQGDGEWGIVAQVLDASGQPLPIELRDLTH